MRPQKERSDAETLYVAEGKSIEQVAAHMKIGASTITRWARSGDWAARRRARQLEVPHPALDVLKRQLDLKINTLGEAATADEIDALHKLSVIIEKMEARLDAVGPMLDVFARFAKFVGMHADDNALAVLRTWTQKFLEDERRKSG